MKKIALSLGLATLVAACNSGSHRASSGISTPEQGDSSVSCVEGDSVHGENTWVAEEVIPATADESFADFFYNFASDAEFQHERILFPLSYYQNSKVVRVPSEMWKFDPMFSTQQAYTVLFDNEEDMEMEKDTALNSVQVDQINLEDEQIRRYYFERKDNRWFLEAVNDEKLVVSSIKKEEDFYRFYRLFSSDSVFQMSRLHEPLAFVTVDPEDEFQILETTLDKGQWFSFRPPMMKGKLTNVHYGQEDVSGSNHKIVEFKGFGNGFSNTLYFKRIGGLWQLMKFEDLSD